MKFAKLFMAIAVVCFAVACGGDKKEDAKDANKVDIETQVEKATKHFEKQEWVDAAEALTKIDPADMAVEVVKETPLREKAAYLTLDIIYSSGNQEAQDIVLKWSDEVEAEVKKLEKE